MSFSMDGVKALLFDKDGTLFDFRATWDVWAAGLISDLSEGDTQRRDELATALDYDWDLQGFRASSFVIAGTGREVAEAIAKVLGRSDIDDIEQDLAQRASRAPVVPAVELAPLLTVLRDAGYALGVMTNDNETAALAHLGAAGVRDQFSFICGSDSGHGAKPDASPVLAFCRHAKVDPSQTLMIGDSLHDLQAALAAGCGAIGVLTGIARAAELSPLADAVLSDIGELPELLGLTR